MADFQSVRDSWKITCIVNPPPGGLVISDIPNQVIFTANGQEIDVLLPATYPNNTSSHISASAIIRGYVVNQQIVLGEYLHTHDELADSIHTHTGLSTLTAGATSDADLLHTHNNLAKLSDLNGLGGLWGGKVDLSDYVTKSGNVSQLNDITSAGSAIESAVSASHAQDHTILEHLDGVYPFTMTNYKKLVNGSNADCCHTHSGSGEHNDLKGLNEGDYLHLTAAEYTALGSVSSSHNDLSGLNVGDYLHLTAVEYAALHAESHTIVSHSDTTATGAELNTLTDGATSNADLLHGHDADNIDILDAGSYYTGTETEAALQEIGLTLSSLAPPTPSFLGDRGASTGIDRITTSGRTAMLTWESDDFLPYVDVDGIGAWVQVSDAEGIDDSFSESGDRGGVINDSTNFTGKLNEDVVADTGSPTPAYVANSFAEGSTSGTNILILEVNGVEFDGGGATNDSTIDLTNISDQDTTTSTNSGLNIGAQQQIKFPNGDNFASYYRTGTWKVDSSDMNNGWNYVRVIHRIQGESDLTTNYVSWVVDDDTTDTVYSTPVLDSLSLTGDQYLSGVRYYTGGTAAYAVDIDNAFKNTYQDGNVITFNCTNGSIPNADLGNSGGDQTLRVAVTNAVFTISSGRKLDATIDVKTSVARTFDANEGNDDGATSFASIVGLLIDDQIASPSNEGDTEEGFNAEGYRMHTGIVLTNTNYGSGTNASDYDWDSTQSLLPTNNNYDDGLLQYGGKLSYPKSTPDSGVTNGDFSKAGTGYEEGYAGNPNYSTASGDRVYLRYFYVGASKSNFVFTISGANATGFTDVGTGANGQDLTLELLAPNTTSDATGSPPSGNIEFKDCYTSHTAIEDDGCYTLGTRDIDTTDWACTLGTRSTADSGNAIVIRITASDAWTGYIESISVVAS